VSEDQLQKLTDAQANYVAIMIDMLETKEISENYVKLAESFGDFLINAFNSKTAQEMLEEMTKVNRRLARNAKPDLGRLE